MQASFLFLLFSPQSVGWELGMQWFMCGGQRSEDNLGHWSSPSTFHETGPLAVYCWYCKLAGPQGPRILLALSSNLLKEHGLQMDAAI